MIISNDSTQRDVEISTFIVQPMDEFNLLGVLIVMTGTCCLVTIYLQLTRKLVCV